MPDYLLLIFGEDDNDRRALASLTKALIPRGTNARVELRRRPVILSREAARSGKRRAMADEIAAFWRAEQKAGRRVVVVAHRDCDRTEPAHLEESKQLEQELKAAGIEEVVPATPAWEIEAWWMLFPGALARTRKCWRRINYGNQHVGRLANAKERLTRDLRPHDRAERKRCADFVESDGVRVAEEILADDLIRKGYTARSDSFEAFRTGIANALADR